MDQYILLSRPFFFIMIFFIMACWEVKSPKRKQSLPKKYRWFHNLSLVFMNSLLLPIVLPLLAIDTAIWAQNHQFGLFNLSPFHSLSFIFICICCILFLDLCIYWQHRIFHTLPWLWRLHAVHHSDQEIDVTTGARFHFFEIILSMIIKCSIVALLGIPWQAVLVFEILLNGCAMFNHANIQLTSKTDQNIRVALVTPDMHRVHHSSLSPEMHKNFGFCLSIWDKIFNSYQKSPQQGHQYMQIGLPYFRHTKEQTFWAMLTQPFRSKK